MTQPNDGGPAFPRFVRQGPCITKHGASIRGLQDGMSRRDWLAGIAMQGFVSDPQTLIGIREYSEQAGITAPAMMALTAYGMADAMIAESIKPQPTEE